jgi:hypothetical protein
MTHTSSKLRTSGPHSRSPISMTVQFIAEPVHRSEARLQRSVEAVRVLRHRGASAVTDPGAGHWLCVLAYARSDLFAEEALESTDRSSLVVLLYDCWGRQA